MNDRVESSWTRCCVCKYECTFLSPSSFIRHLREKHCSREGGSYICRYDSKSVCSSLPPEGVNESDYENHVIKNHVRMRLDILYQSDSALFDIKCSEHNDGCDDCPSRRYVYKDLGFCPQSHTSVNDPFCCSRIPVGLQSLPALLNDPARTKQVDIFTKKWGESFVYKKQSHSDEPKIRIQHFAAYKRLAAQRQDFQDKLHARNSKDNYDSTLCNDLQSIPDIFFEKNFSETSHQFLTNYLNHNSSTTNIRGVDHFQLSSPANDKFTHYLDTIEYSLSKQITQKSDAFFDAMSLHDRVTEQLHITSKTVHCLRSCIGSLFGGQLRDTLLLLRAVIRRHNVMRVLAKLSQMSTVCQAQPTVQALLAVSDYMGALDLISNSQHVLQHTLVNIVAFRYLGVQLSEIISVIDKMAISEYGRSITSYLNISLSEDSQVVDLHSDNNKFRCIVLGLLRLDNMNFVSLFKDEVFTTIDTLVKQVAFEHLAECEDTQEAAESSASGRDLWTMLRVLTVTECFHLLRSVTARIRRLLMRVVSLSEFMCNVVNQIFNLRENSSRQQIQADTWEGFSESKYKSLIASFSSFNVSVLGHIHDHCCCLFSVYMSSLTAHSSSHTDQRVSHMCHLGDVIAHLKEFVTDLEMCCHCRDTRLQTLIVDKVGEFISIFHSVNLANINSALNTESWLSAYVPNKLRSDFLNWLKEDSSTNDTCLSTNTLNSSLYDGQHHQHFACPRSIASHICSETASTHYLCTDSACFVTIASLHPLIQFIIQYSCFVDKFLPLNAVDLLVKLSELITCYNSLSCRLILQAEAVRLGTLKTITLRHLCLLSNSIQFLIFSLPRVSHYFHTVVMSCSPSQLQTFEYLQNNLSTHLNEITSKIVGVTLNSCISSLTRWRLRPPVPSESCQSVCRSVSKLNEVSAALFDSHFHQQLIQRVCDSLIGRIAKSLSQFSLDSAQSPLYGIAVSELLVYKQFISSIGAVYKQDIIDSVWNL